MTPIDLAKAIGDAKDLDIQNAHTPVKPHRAFKPWLLAAAITLTAALVGCTAVYLLSTKDMQLGEKIVVVPDFNNIVSSVETSSDGTRTMTIQGGEYQGQKEVTQQVFSLASWKDSPEYKAAQEWFQFKKNYDPDYKIFEAYREELAQRQKIDPNDSLFPKEYDYYGVYSQEMIDKVDEIAEKYGLKLLHKGKGNHYFGDAEGAEKSYKLAGVDSFLRTESGVSIESVLHASVSEESRFYSDFFLRMPEEKWENPVLTSLTYTPKGYFSTDWYSLDADESWQEVNYTTASGDEVLIVYSLDGVNSYIFCQRSDAVISIRLESRLDVFFEDENGVDHVESTFMTVEQLQHIADALDFSIQLKPDMDFAEQEHQNYQKFKERLDEEQKAREATATEDDERDG